MKNGAVGGINLPERMNVYLRDEKVRQIIVVHAKEKCACAEMFEKETKIDGTAWRKTLHCEAYIGYNGIGKEREGDGKTPTGDFGIVTAFGIRENPGTVLPYLRVTENTFCCSEGPYYNQIVDFAQLPCCCTKGERMIEYRPEYDYGLFLDYNAERVPEKGSAIFFHCRGEKTYTDGCVAAEKSTMVRMLKTVDTGARIIIGDFRQQK